MKLSLIRKSILKYHIGVFMSITVLFFSCTKDKTIAELSTPRVEEGLSSTINTPTISDIDVFKGVMFLEGPLAEKLKDFKEFNIRTFTSNKSKVQQVLDFQSSVIAKLKEGNKNYLAEFRTKIGSGDYYLVKSAIKNAADDIFEASLVLTGSNKSNITDDAGIMSNNFKIKYNLNDNSSKQEILDALKKAFNDNSSSPKNNRNASAEVPSVSVSIYMSAYTIIMIAVVLMLIAVLGVDETFTSIIPSNGTAIRSEGVNNYLYEHFLSQVTLNLSKI